MERRSSKEGSYDASIGDLMASVLFIFILLLIMFILKLNNKKDSFSKPQEVRSELFKKFKKEFKKNGMIVEIDEKNGVLRFASDKGVFFKPNSDKLSIHGENVFTIVREVFEDLLPCYTHSDNFKKYCKDKSKNKGTVGYLETVLIEGHTDRDPLKGKAKENYKDNLDLSSKRALKTFRFLLNFEERKKSNSDDEGNTLYELFNKNSKHPIYERVFGFAGYGALRTLSPAFDKKKLTQKQKKKDRRIDIRFIMSPPKELKKRSLKKK